jgi:hypothetical protein
MAEAARAGLAFKEIAPGGVPYTLRPPRVIGEGNHRVLERKSRSLYAGCLRDARVRSRSGLIEHEGAALFDFEWNELSGIEHGFVFDPPILAEQGNELVVVTAEEPSMLFEEAFTLLGRHTPEFGHWIWEFVPKYVAATMSGLMPRVPILVDAIVPPNLRQLLDLVILPGTEVIEVPDMASVQVRRLWCAPSLMFMPSHLRSVNEKWPLTTTLPSRFASIIHEMWRRIEPHIPSREGPERLYLARKPKQHRKMVNHEAIERIAVEYDFKFIYPQDISFVEQIALVRGAKHILVPEGSGPMLAFFARPGTKLGILSMPFTLGSVSYTSLIEASATSDITIVTGTVVNSPSPYQHFDDYALPEEVFRSFLSEWTKAPPTP